MSDTQTIARQILTEQVLDATSIDEILAARTALRAWIEAHPEERELLRDAFEQLAQMEEIAEAQTVSRVS
jgi:hypothetical protein